MRAFTGDAALGQVNASGNPCSVLITDAKPAPALQHELASTDITQCYTWPADNHAAHVACYTAVGNKIQCCGHGLLSCAAIWTEHWQQQGVLHAGETTLSCRRQGDAIWLGFPIVPVTDCPVPEWLEALLNASAIYCSEAGDEQGYLIAELEQDSDIGQLEPPGDALAQRSGRALIVTCRVSANYSERGEHFHFRYFAPQYGVPEDPATGSAMRLLMRYWHQHGLHETLLARQCSADGGWLQGCIQEGTVWVGGSVKQEADAND